MLIVLSIYSTFKMKLICFSNQLSFMGKAKAKNASLSYYMYCCIDFHIVEGTYYIR